MKLWLQYYLVANRLYMSASVAFTFLTFMLIMAWLRIIYLMVFNLGRRYTFLFGFFLNSNLLSSLWAFLDPAIGAFSLGLTLWAWRTQASSSVDQV